MQLQLREQERVDKLRSGKHMVEIIEEEKNESERKKSHNGDNNFVTNTNQVETRGMNIHM